MPMRLRISASAARCEHPCVKPLAVMDWLLRLVTMPERNLILDPFCGSGSTLVAAAKLGLPAIGIDSDPESTAIAQARVAAVRGPLFAECAE